MPRPSPSSRNPEKSDIIRIVIADDPTPFRAELRILLSAEPDFEVVGEASTPEEALALCETARPHVLLLDVAMTGGRGLDLLEQLRPMRLGARILMFTDAMERAEVVHTLQLGAYGVVLKETPADLLLKSIRHVRAGQYWVGRDIVGDLVRALSAGDDTAARRSVLRAPRAFSLSPRELQIVGAVASGYTNQQMAQKFGLPEDTIEVLLAGIFAKTGVVDRLELALFAIHHRLNDAGA